MKAFIYGRHDVTKNARGYDIFDRDRDIPQDIAKDLKLHFSSEDPDADLLKVLGPFHVYFPLRTDLWVFGKGTFEARGNYYSYLLHGVLLDATELAALDYNPFTLDPLLQTAIGDNRSLPGVDFPDLHKNRLHPQPARALTNLKDPILHYVAGDMAAAILENAASKTATPPIFPYDKRLNADFWHIVFQLLPVDLRRNLSLCTPATFLKKDTQLKGLFPEPPASENHHIINPKRPRRTDMGRFLNYSAAKGVGTVETHFQILDDAYHDAEFLWRLLGSDTHDTFAAFASDYLQNLFKGLEKPSIHSLDSWEKIQSHTQLFPHKVDHYLKVHALHQHELAYFPSLKTEIIRNLKTDYLRIAGKGKVQEAMEHAVLNLKATDEPALAAALMDTDQMSPEWIGRMDDVTLINALEHVDDNPSAFERILTNILKHRSWNDTLDLVWTIKTLFQCSPPTHALLLEWIPLNQSSHFYVDSLINRTYLAAPNQLITLFKVLKSPQIMHRFINYLRKKLAAPHADSAPLLRLLQICKDSQPQTFFKACGPWINKRENEHLLLILLKNRVLAKDLIQRWLEHAENERALLRLTLLISRHPDRKELLNKNQVMKDFLSSQKIADIIMNSATTRAR